MQNFPPLLITMLSAELVFLLARSADIHLILKSDRQLTDDERYRVQHGLRRSIIWDAVLFVPASAVLLTLIAPLILPENWIKPEESPQASYALIGVASFGFPFAAIRQLVSRIALSTLREFAAITPTKEPQPEAETQEGEVS